MSKKYTARSFNMTSSSGTILTAVALQDHWSRSLSLEPHLCHRPVGLGPAVKAKQNHEVKALTDTGRHKGKMKTEKLLGEKITEKEYVLDPKLPPLTLAQKFGLVHAPEPLLTEQDWDYVKAKSNERDDSEEPCVICKEDFGVLEQVILSCTHVFHRACLQALERFTGRKTCPMCRHQQYQTRVIHEGARVYKHKCATRIQALWRGYVVRCWYRQLRETTPPKDPVLRKKFYEEKLSAIVDRMVKSLDVDIGKFMQEIDDSVQRSREIFSQWDAIHNIISAEQWVSIQLKAVERGEMECPICLTELWLPADSSSGNHAAQYSSTPEVNSTQKHSKKKPTNYTRPETANQSVNYHTSFPQAQRIPGDNQQNKCISSEINCNRDKDRSSKPDHVQLLRCPRSTVLLSCTHVFHDTCLRTLEDIAMQDMKNTCPVCRAHYQKTVIVF